MSAAFLSRFSVTFLIGVGLFVGASKYFVSSSVSRARNHNIDTCLILPACANLFPSKFRSIDGSCNNIERPWLGKANRPYRKAMPADYARFETFDLPRGGKEPSTLPAPRKIRLEVHSDSNQPDDSLSTMMMTFGQFISHTLMLTSAAEKSEPFNPCCTPASKTDACFPIHIPANDSFFRQFGIGCRNFKRSPEYCPANRQQRRQTNLVSSFLDLSTVYGSDLNTSNRLRDGGGLLRMGQSSLLPDLPTDAALFDAGDGRVNQNPMLTAMHSLWLREHNRVATQLGSAHLDWSDEKVFQETRRIVTAEFQNVVYNEYLRLLLSPRVYSDWHLNSTGHSFYGSDIDPTITAEVVGAAFRMGHSMVNGDQAKISNGILQLRYKISDYFLRPKGLLRTSTDLDSVLEGMATVPNQKVDRFITDELANRFGKTTGVAFGGDLVSTNLQRGRDHGIPSYNAVRRFCRLQPLSFNAGTIPPAGIDTGAWAALKRAYRTADEIDLFTGGLSELPLSSSVVGPTFTCILSAEFYRLKYGDRYFFTHARGSGSFTPIQLQNILQRRLFDILCDNTGIQFLAPSVLQQPIEINVPVSCSTKRRLNLSLF